MRPTSASRSTAAVDVAKEAADIVLLEHDLGVLHDGVARGPAHLREHHQVHPDGTSSNFGNMFSMAGAALFLPFLPMLPPDSAQQSALRHARNGDSRDHVDAERWRSRVAGTSASSSASCLCWGRSARCSTSSLSPRCLLFGAGQALFQTGWFIELLATQCLVIFIIRTRGVPWGSRPHPLLTTLTLAVVAIGLLISLTPFGRVLDC